MRITGSDESGVTCEAVLGEGRVDILECHFLPGQDLKNLSKENIRKLAEQELAKLMNREAELRSKLGEAERLAKSCEEQLTQAIRDRERRFEEVNKLSAKLDFAIFQATAAKNALQDILATNLDVGRSWTSVRDILNLLFSQLAATKSLLEKW